VTEGPRPIRGAQHQNPKRSPEALARTEADFVGLAWRCGSLSVQRLGAMLGPLTFILEDGRQVSPLYLAPWSAHQVPPPLAPVLQGLRGEWPCVPFGAYREPKGFPPEWASVIGADEGERHLHGYGSNVAWRWNRVTAEEVELSCRYPEGHDIEELVRRIRPLPDRPAVDLELIVRARRRTHLPAGLHFTFARPRTIAKLRPGRYSEAWTMPGPPYERIQAFATDRRFEDLSRVPARAGGYVNASLFPPAVPAEDNIQLNQTDGHFQLDLEGDDCRISLEWERKHFPSVMLWISNRGLEQPPWNAQHVALGIEPVCSPFGLGLAAARAENPIRRSGVPTTIEFDPAVAFHTRYRISAEALVRRA
jgi:hypothetical protein